MNENGGIIVILAIISLVILGGTIIGLNFIQPAPNEEPIIQIEQPQETTIQELENADTNYATEEFDFNSVYVANDSNVCKNFLTQTNFGPAQFVGAGLCWLEESLNKILGFVNIESGHFWFIATLLLLLLLVLLWLFSWSNSKLMAYLVIAVGIVLIIVVLGGL